jgi:hypothetical protein
MKPGVAAFALWALGAPLLLAGCGGDPPPPPRAAPAPMAMAMTPPPPMVQKIPGMVRSIQFGGAVLDGAHTVSWGSWTAGFAPLPPQVSFTPQMRTIAPISCSSAGTGMQTCSITIADGVEGKSCALLVDGQQIAILCPDSVMMQF